jgi:hypothetical protein
LANFAQIKVMILFLSVLTFFQETFINLPLSADRRAIFNGQPAPKSTPKGLMMR